MGSGGGWPKLSVFSSALYNLKGRALFVDLDTVIWGSLDRYFDFSAPFVAIDTGDNWRPGKVSHGDGPEVGTGVFAFNIGEQAQILKLFQQDEGAAFKDCVLEQIWVQKTASSLSYWPKDWVISFKRWLRRPIGLDLFMQPKAPPSRCSIVAFHGDPRPIALVAADAGRWDHFPHMGHGQVSWMRDYWLQNGGNLRPNRNDAS